jgi:hypothetical protein
MNDLEENPDLALLQKHCDQLMEHFETCRIFVTRPSDQGTVTASFGRVNWFGQYGQIKFWIQIEEKAFNHEQP